MPCPPGCPSICGVAGCVEHVDSPTWDPWRGIYVARCLRSTGRISYHQVYYDPKTLIWTWTSRISNAVPKLKEKVPWLVVDGRWMGINCGSDVFDHVACGFFFGTWIHDGYG
ncbi:unnamed protein product [Durusdinium trenchii]|uniref:Uncharacterized protein n=1 Tax=Durusdinium trenchii TaxID=1381693 RepID=A0ABP0JHL5_9DINO